MASSHLDQRCLCQKAKKSTLHTQYLNILVGLIRPPGESAGIFCSVHPQVPQETHRDFTDVHSISRTARSIHVTAKGMFAACFYFVVNRCLHSFKTIIMKKKKKVFTFCRRAFSILECPAEVTQSLRGESAQ